MSKAVTRVHILAKELGVKSKSIVDKCQAEGLDIKNHMSTISAGLAATIREWFSEGDHATTIETTKRVDLTKVRIRKKKKAKKKTVEAAVEEESPVVAPVAEPAEAEVKPAKKAKAKAKVKKAKAKAKAKPKPKPIVPAGPMLEKPKPAKLTGPKVVRVEKIEPHEQCPRRVGRGPGTAAPARGRPTRPKYDEPISEPLIPKEMEEVIGIKSKKGKDRTRGRRKDRPPEPDEEKRPRLSNV